MHKIIKIKYWVIGMFFSLQMLCKNLLYYLIQKNWLIGVYKYQVYIW